MTIGQTTDVVWFDTTNAEHHKEFEDSHAAMTFCLWKLADGLKVQILGRLNNGSGGSTDQRSIGAEETVIRRSSLVSPSDRS